jgi:signal transduction histidine kinase
VFLGIKLSISQIEPDTNDTKEQERLQTLIEISSATEVALDILNELLLYDKLEKGMLELNKQKVGASDIIHNAIKMFAVQIREKLICLEVDLGSDINHETRSELDVLTTSAILSSDTLFVDRQKITQVIRNLLSNAIKFTPQGGRIKIQSKFISNASQTNRTADTSITASQNEHKSSRRETHHRNTMSARIIRGLSTLSHESNYVIEIPSQIKEISEGFLEICVSDSGAGISTEDQIKLFKEVVQFHPEILQSGGGSGLGMWISKNIVDLHQGNICKK